MSKLRLKLGQKRRKKLTLLPRKMLAEAAEGVSEAEGGAGPKIILEVIAHLIEAVTEVEAEAEPVAEVGEVIITNMDMTTIITNLIIKMVETKITGIIGASHKTLRMNIINSKIVIKTKLEVEAEAEVTDKKPIITKNSVPLIL